ncbi:uncharacterized protein PG986_000009 [Apiospora aurea]|uniref:Uncharacterized protein n=1 Tax=Apiospora aurea TaxID=335848 RepID=A0ABR1QT75_9PEZI
MGRPISRRGWKGEDLVKISAPAGHFEIFLVFCSSTWQILTSAGSHVTRLLHQDRNASTSNRRIADKQIDRNQSAVH